MRTSNMPTAAIYLDWSTRRKLFIATLTLEGAGPIAPVTKVATLDNELRPPIDAAGGVLLLEALRREYSSWLL